MHPWFMIHEFMIHDSMNHELMIHDAWIRECMNHESMNHESFIHQFMNHESCIHDTWIHESWIHDSWKHDITQPGIAYPECEMQIHIVITRLQTLIPNQSLQHRIQSDVRIMIERAYCKSALQIRIRYATPVPKCNPRATEHHVHFSV